MPTIKKKKLALFLLGVGGVVGVVRVGRREEGHGGVGVGVGGGVEKEGSTLYFPLQSEAASFMIKAAGQHSCR